jgi:hypothetical protein
MFIVVLSPGDKPLSVKLTLDLSIYCVACKALQKAEFEKSPADIAKIMPSFIEHRKKLLTTFHFLTAGFYWSDIKRKLSKQCEESSNPPEKALAETLADVTNTKPAPHAIVSLNNSFIELLKNSIDALIYQYLSSASDEMVLQMHIELEISGANLIIRLTDNAGGFPPEYISSFASDIARRAYKHTPFTSDKMKASSYYLGGKGIALGQLYSMLLDGEVWNGSFLPHKFHSIAEGSTSISIANDPVRKGAQIVLMSPIAPLPRFIFESHVSHETLKIKRDSAAPAGIKKARLSDCTDRPCLTTAESDDDEIDTLSVRSGRDLARSKFRDSLPFFKSAPLTESTIGRSSAISFASGSDGESIARSAEGSLSIFLARKAFRPVSGSSSSLEEVVGSAGELKAEESAAGGATKLRK